MSSGNPTRTRQNKVRRLKKHLETKKRGKFIHAKDEIAIKTLKMLN